MRQQWRDRKYSSHCQSICKRKLSWHTFFTYYKLQFHNITSPDNKIYSLREIMNKLWHPMFSRLFCFDIWFWFRASAVSHKALTSLILALNFKPSQFEFYRKRRSNSSVSRWWKSRQNVRMKSDVSKSLKVSNLVKLLNVNNSSLHTKLYLSRFTNKKVRKTAHVYEI